MLSALTSSEHLGSNPVVDPRQVAQTLGLTLQDLAKVIGVSRNTLTESNSPKVQKAMAPTLKILATATEMSGAVAQAVHWFKFVPLPSLGFKTAMELVSEGKQDWVMAHFEDMRNSVYS
jgi:transcriptional regulator with XRE-family HTH domain